MQRIKVSFEDVVNVFTNVFKRFNFSFLSADYTFQKFAFVRNCVIHIFHILTDKRVFRESPSVRFALGFRIPATCVAAVSTLEATVTNNLLEGRLETRVSLLYFHFSVPRIKVFLTIPGVCTECIFNVEVSAEVYNTSIELEAFLKILNNLATLLDKYVIKDEKVKQFIKQLLQIEETRKITRHELKN